VKRQLGRIIRPAALYVVATPIGNLADITLRALHVLQLADVVACEDTRHTQALLRAYGIDKAPSQLLAVHQHNEAQAVQDVLDRLRQGLRVAYVSDAGTPAVSDPGARLVAGVRQAGLLVMPLPGASSVTSSVVCVGHCARYPPARRFCVCRVFAHPKPWSVLPKFKPWPRRVEPLCLLEAPAPH
jgi:16S rRNA (cytidine1402-2'-O)-methyltransferase